MRLTLVSAVLLAVGTMVSAASLQERAASCTVVSGVCGKSKGNGATGACCTSNNDCKDTCNSSGCGAYDGTKPKTTCSTTSSSAKPIPTNSYTYCRPITGICAYGNGRGITGDCCISDNDCQDTCTSNGCGTYDGSKPLSSCNNGGTLTTVAYY